MIDPWKIFAAIAALALFYVVLPEVASLFGYYRGRRRFRCPETGAEAEVDVDARHAALTAAFGPPRLRAKTCSLWPARQGCAQGCLGTAEGEPETREA